MINVWWTLKKSEPKAQKVALLFEEYVRSVQKQVPLLPGLARLVVDYWNPLYSCSDCNQPTFFQCAECRTEGLHPLQKTEVCQKCLFEAQCATCNVGFTPNDPRCEICQFQVHADCVYDDLYHKRLLPQIFCERHKWHVDKCEECDTYFLDEKRGCKSCWREVCASCCWEGYCPSCATEKTCFQCDKPLENSCSYQCQTCGGRWHVACKQSQKRKTLQGDYHVCCECWSPWLEHETQKTKNWRHERKKGVLEAGFAWHSLLCKNFKHGCETHKDFMTKYRLFVFFDMQWDQKVEQLWNEGASSRDIKRWVQRREMLKKELGKNQMTYETDDLTYVPFFGCRAGHEQRLLRKVVREKQKHLTRNMLLIRLEAFLCDLPLNRLPSNT